MTHYDRLFSQRLHLDYGKGGDFNMIERPSDKPNDFGRAIDDLEQFSWNRLMDTLQLQDYFVHQGGPRVSWTNGQYGQTRRLARLDRFYTANNDE